MSAHDQTEAPSYDDVNTPVIMLVGAISAIVTLLIIYFVQGLAYHWQNSYLSPMDTQPTSVTAVETINDQKLALEKASTPIETAMAEVVAESK